MSSQAYTQVQVGWVTNISITAFSSDIWRSWLDWFCVWKGLSVEWALPLSPRVYTEAMWVKSWKISQKNQSLQFWGLWYQLPRPRMAWSPESDTSDLDYWMMAQYLSPYVSPGIWIWTEDQTYLRRNNRRRSRKKNQVTDALCFTYHIIFNFQNDSMRLQDSSFPIFRMRRSQMARATVTL